MPLTRSIKTESNVGQCDDLSELIPNLQWLSKFNVCVRIDRSILDCSNGFQHGSKCQMKCSRHYTVEHGTTAHCDVSKAC